jgi:hypothetical protein
MLKITKFSQKDPFRHISFLYYLKKHYINFMKYYLLLLLIIVTIIAIKIIDKVQKLLLPKSKEQKSQKVQICIQCCNLLTNAVI